jgi:predicted translation initiation factor SUI1
MPQPRHRLRLGAEAGQVGLPGMATDQLAALLKQRCGTGGTVKDGRIEIQGDQRERIVAELEKLGYKLKRVGG